ncbi:uncharacterized protein AMSG_11833 [Thecamonas trahens ATCC 50062]|uniref:Uncharacterized protein n=1 Tax=Thecamonas trahens ATCC 50062 TaxID=461836 RepID=A0A0L0D8A0_THETB|nr:hypothetical protein AMSG_11833 [Thecamonas trahens ATCC 50062]KNC48470.1 hypothetical protein AMSG_11833 [Thecamonas trahens ATCC 50062]|eukprot:XP_013758668.1 hypothetical protein AMSG_11833 [Thecamonas trahens ATCC 50062]
MSVFTKQRTTGARLGLVLVLVVVVVLVLPLAAEATTAAMEELAGEADGGGGEAIRIEGEWWAEDAGVKGKGMVKTPVAPKYVGTIKMGTSGSWKRVKADRTYLNNVIFLAGTTLIGMVDGGVMAHKTWQLPPGVSSPIGYYSQPYYGYLALTPSPDLLVYYRCDDPCSDRGQDCALTPYLNLTLPNVTASTDWVDLATGESEVNGQSFGYLFGDDLTVVEVSDLGDPDNAFVSATFSLSDLVPAVVAKYPYLLAAVGTDYNPNSRTHLWIVLTTEDPVTASSPPPAVVLTFAIGVRKVEVVSFTLPTPMGIVHYTGFVSLTHYGVNGTNLIAYDDDKPGQNITASWPALGMTASACAVDSGAAEEGDHGMFVASRLTSGTGSQIVILDSDTGVVSRIGSGPSTPSTVAWCSTHYHYNSDKFIAFADRSYHNNVMFVAGSSVVGVVDGEVMDHAAWLLPAGVSAAVGYYVEPYNGYLALATAHNLLQYYKCDNPFSNYHQECSLKLHSSLTLPNVSASASWVDVATGSSPVTGDSYGYLFADDLTVVEIKDFATPDDAIVTRTFSLAEVVPSVAVTYPYLLAVDGVAYDPYARNSIMITLTGVDPTTPKGKQPPGALVNFVVGGGAAEATVSFAMPTPMGVVFYGEWLAMTYYGAGTTEMMAFDLSQHTLNITLSWPVSGTTTSACAVDSGAINSRDHSAFVVSRGGSGVAAEVVYVDSHAKTASPPATSSGEPSFVAKCTTHFNYAKSAFIAYVPSTASNGSQLVAVFSYDVQ